MSTDMVRLHLSAERRLEGGVRVDEPRAVDAVRHAGVVEHREEIVRREGRRRPARRGSRRSRRRPSPCARARAAHRRRSCRRRVRTCRACASRGAQPERSRAPARRGARLLGVAGADRVASTTVSAPASAIAVTTARTRASSTSPSRAAEGHRGVRAHLGFLRVRHAHEVKHRHQSIVEALSGVRLLCVSVHETTSVTASSCARRKRSKPCLLSTSPTNSMPSLVRRAPTPVATAARTPRPHPRAQGSRPRARTR